MMRYTKLVWMIFLICGGSVCMGSCSWFPNGDNCFEHEKIPLKFKSMSAERLDKAGVDFGIEVVEVDEKKAPRRYPRKGYIVQLVERDTVRNMEEFKARVIKLIESEADYFYLTGVYPDDKGHIYVYTIRLKSLKPNVYYY